MTPRIIRCLFFKYQMIAFWHFSCENYGMDFAYLQGFFIQGDISGAMAYMAECSELRALLPPYEAIFEREEYLHYGIPLPLDEILLEYQRYFRDVFYLHRTEEDSVSLLLSRLKEKLSLPPSVGEDVLGEALTKTFEKAGYHILTGVTNGHYGPYVWKETVPTTYLVELPSGTRRFTVNFLKGFVMRSWMDYLTFGKFSTGGWAGKDGIINCVENAYDTNSERFQISLLKHEAQHVYDMERWDNISAVQLEYRAKLVELIYSSTKGLLEKFLQEGDAERTNDSHAQASFRLQKEMGEYRERSVEEIQEKAKALLALSTQELDLQFS